MGNSFEHFLHPIPGAVTDLVQNTADIGSENAETDQNEAADKKDED